MRKHIDSCQVCKKEYEDFKFKNMEIKIHIPKPLIDSETREIFNREISELFKTLELGEKTIFKKKIKTNIKMIDRLGASVVKNLTSKTMLASYAFGVVLFIVLRKFF
jgi:DNA polymerase I-like protein with 3'-5' exonuclease and polymerase domains